MIRVAVVDDHPLFQSGVVSSLRAAQHFEVVAQGASADDALRISREFHPDVLVLDLNLPGRGEGLGVIVAVAAAAPEVRILVLTLSSEDDMVREAMSNGAKGYVLKGIAEAELVHAVRSVHSGVGYVTPTLAARLFATATPLRKAQVEGSTKIQLSARETQILRCIARGLSNKEVALQLCLSEKTVKAYITNLFIKMRVRNRTEAAILVASITSLPGDELVLRRQQ